MSQIPVPGDFNRLNLEQLWKDIFSDAYQAVTITGNWEYIAKLNPESFMFTKDPEVLRINKEMKYDGHSGSSYGFTMRTMERIAKYGWEKYAKEIGICPSPLDIARQLGDKKQIEAMEKFSKGGMTYAEMRVHCG